MMDNKTHEASKDEEDILYAQGECWLFGDNVDTDQILPGYAMAEPADKLGMFAFAGSAVPDFAGQVHTGDIVVAGQNFGCGSSREQAPVALLQAGVRLVIAASFARIFRRNAINIGLPVLVADLTGHVRQGDMLIVDIARGHIIRDGKQYHGTLLSESSLATLRSGGLINRVRQELAGRPDRPGLPV
jgi:3-isopropylmalate dehydratase small subunit